MGVSLSKGGNVSLTKEAPGLSAVDIAVGRSNNVYVAIVISGRLAGVFRSGVAKMALAFW